jgi:hypothetical protein
MNCNCRPKSANSSRSGDFAGNYAEPASVKQLEPYVKAVQKTVAEQSQIGRIMAQ